MIKKTFIKPQHFHNKRIQAEPEFKINKMITVSKIRLIGDNIENRIYSLTEALAIAKSLQLDLIELSIQEDNVAVCKITDYNKFLYERKKKDKEKKVKSKALEVKEIRFNSNIEEHDFEFKTKHIETFLQEGHKVRVYIMFKGRTLNFQERSKELLQTLSLRIEDVGHFEDNPKLEDKKIYVLLIPKSKKA